MKNGLGKWVMPYFSTRVTACVLCLRKGLFRYSRGLVKLAGIGIFWLYAVCAQASGPSGLGKMADNLLAVVKSAQSFLQFLCVAIGLALILASFGQFKKHWQNPVQVSLSKPIAMIFLGIGLIILGLIPMGV